MVDRWPLTGRGEELRFIGGALAGSDHQGVVVAGNSGVGKTRLARAAADSHAQHGWTVRRIAGTTTGRAVTLGAFARWADATDTSPLSLTRKVFGGLTAGTHGAPLLIFVDDAHLLDDMSSLIVHQIALQGVARIIATIRTGEPAPDAVTALWKDGLLQRLELQPLSRNESDQLLQVVLDGQVSSECADRMWRLSRGNVLFLHHLVEHERESGRLALVGDEWHLAGEPLASPSLVELVERQIGAVPDDVREVVDLVAIAEPIDRTVLSELTDTRSVEAAEQRDLITAAASGDAVYVGHPLYGEIRLSQCGPLRLKRLRGRVAGVMANLDDVDPLRLGLLWLESDLTPDVEILSRAAYISGSRLDVGLAERLARAAVDANASPATKLALAYCLVLQAKGEEVEEILDTLKAGDLAVPGLVDGVILRAANHLFLLRNPDGALAVLDDAIRLGDEERNHGLRAFHAVAQVMVARPAETVKTAEAVDFDRVDSFGFVTGCAAETIALGDLGRVDDARRRASAGYRVLADSPLEAFHGTGLAEFEAYALLAAGYVTDAVAAAERECRRCLEIPGMSRSLAIAALGMTALGQGDLASALRHLRSASRTLAGDNEIFVTFYRFRILLTEALARSGDIDAAVASLELTRQSRHPGYMYVESDFLMADAWVSAVQGLIPDARETNSRATEFARSHGQLAREVLSLQTAVQFGDTGGADRLDELAAAVEGPRAPLAARYAHALADEDGAALDAVSSDFESMGDALAAADAAAHAATCYRRAARRGSALTSSARARLLAKRCGDAVSPALAAALVPLPFTRREHEIAKLLSNGRSNKEIAEAMCLSVRTVEGHIYQASAKAGVSSRSELAELVQRFTELETG
jgi:DNA-binding CsgD family transcriptional regulator